MASKKANVLVLGGGAVGAIAALNLEVGGLADVTVVLRSNYNAVSSNGYTINSIDHGHLPNWRPFKVLPSVPDITSLNLPPYDYIILTTKNIPDIAPSISSLIAPAITPGHTIIVMIQNGLNIEKPLFTSFPKNMILSGVSMIDSHESSPGVIEHEEHDLLYIGPFISPSLPSTSQIAAAKDFISIYNAASKSTVEYSEDVAWTRWRKLVFNACFNPICAITGLDDARIRIAGAIDGLVRPAMKEIIAVAAKLGHKLPEGIDETMINLDPLDLYLRPSMQCDIEKGNFMEFENLVGEPLREAEKCGVETPILRVIYELCKALQWKTMEKKGLVIVPPKRKI